MPESTMPKKGVAMAIHNYAVGDEFVKITFRRDTIYMYTVEGSVVTVETDEIHAQMMQRVFKRHFKIIAGVNPPGENNQRATL